MPARFSKKGLKFFFRRRMFGEHLVRIAVYLLAESLICYG